MNIKEKTEIAKLIETKFRNKRSMLCDERNKLLVSLRNNSISKLTVKSHLVSVIKAQKELFKQAKAIEKSLGLVLLDRDHYGNEREPSLSRLSYLNRPELSKSNPERLKLEKHYDSRLDALAKLKEEMSLSLWLEGKDAKSFVDRMLKLLERI